MTAKLNLSFIMLAMLFNLPSAEAQSNTYFDFSAKPSGSYAEVNYNDELIRPGFEQSPAVRLRKRGDHVGLKVTVINDSLNNDDRIKEIRATIRTILEQAKNKHLQLVAADTAIDPDNIELIDIAASKGKTDTSSAQFIVKAPLGPDEDARRAEQKLQEFAKELKGTGRSQVVPGEFGLAISNPDRYRLELLGIIADDAKKVRALFGEDYRIAAIGLDRALKWRRVNASEFELYLEYHYGVVPKFGSSSSQ